MATNEEDDFLALERIYLRLGHASDAAQLTYFCEKNLQFLLERLEASVVAKPPDVASRDKILDILTQLKKRLRSNPEIMLPVDFLVNEYKKESSALIKNFSFLFLKIGYSRLAFPAQVSFATKLFEAVANKTYDQQLGIWLNLLPVIRGHYGITNKNRSNEEKSPPLFDLFSPAISKPIVSKFLDFCGDFLLLTESFASSQPRNFARLLLNAEADEDDEMEGHSNIGEGAGSVRPPAPPGISASFHKTLMEEVKTSSLAYLSPSGSETSRAGSSPLIETKIGILRMLSTCRLPSEEVAWLWALASADSHHSVVHDAEMQLKQAPGASLKHVNSIRKLYERFLGTDKNQAVAESERRTAVGLKTKLKLMTYFVRYADTAAGILPQSVQIVFENWFGRGTNDRLRLLGTELALHVVTKIKGKTAAVFAPILFANVRKLLDETKDPKLGCSCYAVMGQLGKLHTDYVLVGNKRIESIQELFDDLSQIGNDEICSAVQTCLLEWLDGFTRDDAENAEAKMAGTLLEACILAYAEHKSPKCRLTALRFLDKLFSPDHAPSRFAVFMACADKDEKVKREAMGILRKTEAAVRNRESDGSFEQACRYFYGKIDRLFERQENTSGSVTADILQQIISYLHGRLIKERHHAKPSVHQMDVDDGSIIVDSSEDDGCDLDVYFGSEATVEEWRSFFEIIMIYLEKFGANNEDILDYLAEIVFLCPKSVVKSQLLPHLAPMMPKLLDSLHTSTIEGIIIRLAEILSHFHVLTVSTAEIERDVELGLQHLKGDDFLSPSKVYFLTLIYEQLVGEASNRSPGWIVYTQALCDRFRRSVSNWEMANLDVAVTGLKTLARNGALKSALPDDTARQSLSTAAVEVVKSRKDIVSNRHKERCVDLIGCSITGEPGLELWKKVVEEIMQSAEGPPNIGLQPAIGKMLVAYCISPVECSPYCGIRQRYTQSTNDLKRRLLQELSNQNEKTTEVGRRITWLLERLIGGQEAERLAKNKNYKQASCIWLEVFLQICGQCSVAQGFFDQLQTFSISCLAEQNDFTQDVASRCLSLLFHCTQSNEQRSVLARSMREQLTATTAKETLLPYQELCSLCAVNCQRPELVYDMMLLALNRRSDGNASGNKADRSAWLIAYSSEKLTVFERVLVPPVFRLTYDPNPNVRRVLQNLWASMNEHNRKAADGNAENKGSSESSLMEKYRREIFDHLLYCLEASQWRYREASCIALNDLINSSHVSGFELEKIGDLWQRGLRVLDDIKESVATAAGKLIHALHKYTIRMCSSDGSPSIVLPIVVPQLIEYGLQSSAGAVRLTSLITLMELIKESPPSILKPHLATLMSTFLDALSWTENVKINELSMRASAEQREQIDQARVAASKSSPIMDSLETCSRHVDSSILQTLVPKLVQTLQANVGLSTKSGACRLVIMLRAQAPSDLAPFADSILKCLTRCLTDRNTTFRKQAASTIGHLAPLCSDSALGNFFNTVQQWYLDTENPSMEVSCAYGLRSVASYASDVLKKFSAQAAPVAFLAIHNDRTDVEQTPEQLMETEALKAVWDEVLSELRLSAHVFDVYEFCARLLVETPSWKMKAVSAKSIGALVEKMEPDLPFEKIRCIVVLLVKSLEGRTWDGKETVIISLGSVCQKFKGTLAREMSGNDKALMADTLLRECHKTARPKYRAHAITQTGIIAEALGLQIWKKLYDILAPCFQTETESETEDAEASAECRRVSYLTLARCLQAGEAQEYGEDVRKYGSMLLEKLPVSIWRDQIYILDGVLLIFDRNLSNVIVDDVAVMDVLATVLANTRQLAVKQRCVAIFRACCTCLLEIPARLVSWQHSPSSTEVMKRLLDNEFLKAQAKDLIDEMEKCWKSC